MPRPVRLVAIILAGLYLAGAAFYAVKNPERGPLDAAARATQPGQYVRLEDGITHYDVTGPDTGRTVVLVHGFSVPMYIWDSTVAGLSAAGYRVIRYDVFGRGFSDRPDAPYDGALTDRQLNGLLDSLHVVGKVDLMGLSYGGFVTAHFTAANPARVRTLTLVDPVAQSRTLPGVMTAPFIGPIAWQVLAVPGMAQGQPSDFLHPEKWPDWVSRYEPQMRYEGFGRALLRSSVTSSTTNYAELYAAVGKTGIPVHLIWGKQDATVPIRLAPVVTGGIPGIRFTPVDSAGHLPHMEQAAVVRAAMVAFLAGHPAP